MREYHNVVLLELLVQLLQEPSNAFFDFVDSLSDVRVGLLWVGILVVHDRSLVLTRAVELLMHVVRDTVRIGLWRCSRCAAVLELCVAARRW